MVDSFDHFVKDSVVLTKQAKVYGCISNGMSKSGMVYIIS